MFSCMRLKALYMLQENSYMDKQAGEGDVGEGIRAQISAKR